jgi:hypothetical protein
LTIAGHISSFAGEQQPQQQEANEQRKQKEEEEGNHQPRKAKASVFHSLHLCLFVQFIIYDVYLYHNLFFESLIFYFIFDVSKVNDVFIK